MVLIEGDKKIIEQSKNRLSLLIVGYFNFKHFAKIKKKDGIKIKFGTQIYSSDSPNFKKKDKKI